MNRTYQAFHFCPRPDGKGMTVTKGPIPITLRDALRQLTPNVHETNFGFCFYPNEVKEYLAPMYKGPCSRTLFEAYPMSYGAVLTRENLDQWRFPNA